jgi:hypothetical protein
MFPAVKQCAHVLVRVGSTTVPAREVCAIIFDSRAPSRQSEGGLHDPFTAELLREGGTESTTETVGEKGSIVERRRYM